VRTMLADQPDIAYASSTHPQEAVELAAAFRPTLILQDLVMPGLDGLDMVRRFRGLPATRDVPIIMLSAREEAGVKARLFEGGANDYLIKLPDPIELIARIRAVLRRAEAVASPVAAGSRLRIAEAEVDLEGQRVLRDGAVVHLKPKAFQLLAFLIENAGRVYTREQLLDKVWGYDYAGETRTVDVHMHALRQAMEAIPAEPVALQTVRGIGYVLRRPA